MVKKIGIVILVLVVAGSLTIVDGATAMAAPSESLVTLKGHVRDISGAPIAGITVFGGLNTGDVKPADPYASDITTTNSAGRYELTVSPSHELLMKFTDEAGNYLGADKSRFTGKAGSTYAVNRTLDLKSEIAGTVRDEDGTPIAHATVKIFAAQSGKGLGSVATNSKGRYHFFVPGGTYNLRFARRNVATGKESAAEWFGDATTRASSPDVKVGPGSKTAGKNVTLN